MYLTEAIHTKDGERYPMLGIIPGDVAMQNKLAALGYREITGMEHNFLIGANEKAKGHEFHFSIYQGEFTQPAYRTKGMFGEKVEGYLRDHIVAGYTHFHFASNPNLVDNWLKACLEV